MTTWLPIYHDDPRGVAVRRLCAELKMPRRVAWAWYFDCLVFMQLNEVSGDLSAVSATDLESCVEWDGPPGDLYRALAGTCDLTGRLDRWDERVEYWTRNLNKKELDRHERAKAMQEARDKKKSSDSARSMMQKGGKPGVAAFRHIPNNPAHSEHSESAGQNAGFVPLPIVDSSDPPHIVTEKERTNEPTNHRTIEPSTDTPRRGAATAVVDEKSRETETTDSLAKAQRRKEQPGNENLIGDVLVNVRAWGRFRLIVSYIWDCNWRDVQILEDEWKRRNNSMKCPEIYPGGAGSLAWLICYCVRARAPSVRVRWRYVLGCFNEPTDKELEEAERWLAKVPE